MIESLRRDLTFAWRQLRLSPAVTAVALLSLALGVGANTAIFSLVNAMLLKSLPVHEPERLVELNDTITNPIWESLRERQDAFTGVLAYSSTTFNLARRGQARNARGIMVSGNAFDVLGLQPALGRLLTVADDRRDGGPEGPVAILSYGFWQREYGGLPTILGQDISLNGHSFHIVGVAPQRFTGLVVGEMFDIAVTINTQAILSGDRHMLDERGAWWLTAVGRLAPGQTLDDAQARIRAVQPQIRTATMPSDWTQRDLDDYLKEPLTLQEAGGFSVLRRRYTQPLLVLMGIVGLLLLIACANLANLLLARAAARQREIAVRLSLGASRRQLIRQLLIESLLLASLGAAAGMAVAQAGSRLLLRMISTPGNVAFLDLTIDWRVLGFSIGLATITGVIFGLAPAIRGTAVGPADAMRQSSRGVVGATRRFGVGQTLVAAQVALSLILVFAATLFVRSFVGLSTQTLGFDAARVIAVEIDLRSLQVEPARQPVVIEQIVDRVKSVPGVASAALGLVTPVSSAAWILNVDVPGYAPTSDRDGRSFVNGVTTGYFQTLGTPLLAGRDFTPQDRVGAEPVAIVNEAFVRKFLAGRDPLGIRFRSGSGPRKTEVTIVGVVGDAKYRYLREETATTFYVPALQQAASFFNPSVYVRTDLEPTSLTTALAGAVADVHPDAVVRFKPLSEIVGAAMLTERVVATLSGLFGGLALLLAMVGLYGVMAYAVARRRTEIGVRMALGAAPARVVGMVLREVGYVTVIGLAVGAAAGLALARLVASLLFGLLPTDLVTMLIAIALLAGSALVAGYLPARHASRVDPMLALRDN
jgi:putative ABC transport system permease protein